MLIKVLGGYIMNNIKEFISISTERPSDVIRETIDYMTNIARRSN